MDPKNIIKWNQSLRKTEHMSLEQTYWVVVGHGIHAAELAQVVLVRGVVSVPGHNIEGSKVASAHIIEDKSTK